MNIEKEVTKTIKKYKLINDGDKIIVALSGGKDSTSILYILKNLGYNIEGLMIDLGFGEWSKIHKKNMIRLCKKFGVSLTIVDLKKELGWEIRSVKMILKKQKNLTECAICGIIKKWILNKWAKKLGADKLVTGHNLDDEAQNVLMNFLKGNILLGTNSSPATGETSVKGFAQRIKPLFFVPESEIMKYAKEKKFNILYDRCPYAFKTYRIETREWITKNLTDKEKLEIVENFQKLIPELQKKNLRKTKTCKKCGEPANSELCNFCKIMENI